MSMVDVRNVPSVRAHGRLGLTMPPQRDRAQPARGGQRNNMFSWFFPRALFSRLAGGSFMGSRDFYGAFGWDYRIETLAVWKMYARGGITRTIAHAYGDATWGNPPEIKATAGAQKRWMSNWEDIVEDNNLWSILSRIDTLCNLGPFAIAVIGVKDGGKLEEPLPENPNRSPEDLLFIQPFSNRSAIISVWGTDPTQPRFGMPLMYTIYPGLARTEDTLFGANSVGQPMQIPNQGSFKVHWSRVVHYAVGALEQEIFGVPIIWTVWNLLTDLQKITGGSAETYWMTSNRGLQLDVDKEMDMDPDDEAALAQEIDEYTDGLRRVIRTRGITAKDLGVNVADPSSPASGIMSQISGTTRIPMRILLGAESAHQASTQDKGTWAERRIEYRNLTAWPHILKPTIICLTRMGFLPRIKMKAIEQDWPDAYALSPLEEAQMNNQWGMALANASTAIQNTPNLATTEEVRSKFGLTPDPADGPHKTQTRPEPALVNPDLLKKGPGGVGDGTGDDKASSSSNTDDSGRGAPNNPRGATDR